MKYVMNDDRLSTIKVLICIKVKKLTKALNKKEYVFRPKMPQKNLKLSGCVLVTSLIKEDKQQIFAGFY